jgi:hypothetical protein
MAEAMSLQVGLKLVGALTNALDLSTPSDLLGIDATTNFGNGTGANQGNMWWHDQRTLTASATENIDLAGSLVSAFGTTITFTSVKAIYIKAAAGNTNNVNVARGSSNGFVMFLAASDGFALPPGSWACFVNPNANGWAVTASTGDILTITNSAGSTSVTYDIFIAGEV